MKNPDRPGDIDSFFETMEPDLKQIIAGHPVVTEDGHCCDFIFQLFKTYMLENSPINNRPRWELYGHGDHWQDFASWFRSMLSRYLKRKPPKGWKKRLEQAALVERRHKRGRNS